MVTIIMSQIETVQIPILSGRYFFVVYSKKEHISFVAIILIMCYYILHSI